MGKRKQYIDYTAGLMILTMVIEHLTVFCKIYDSVGYYIIHFTSFFMNWFFFKSGMFLRKDETFVQCVYKGIRKLLVPYCVFTIIGVIVNFSKGIPEGITPYITLGYLNHHESLWGGVYLWFLPSLFVCKCIMNIVIKWGKIYLLYISLFLSFCIYIYSMSFKELAIWMYNIPLGLIFMHLGYILKDVQFDNRIWYCSAFLYVLLIFFPTVIDVIEGTMTPLIPAFLYSISGCIVWHNICKRMAFHKIVVFKWIGENAMAVYLLHWPILSLLIQNVEINTNLKLIVFLFVFCILCIVLIPLSLSYIRKWHLGWVLGQ